MINLIGLLLFLVGAFLLLKFCCEKIWECS